MLYRFFFFSKICTASSYYNVFITIIIIIRIITIIIVGTTTCERHRSSVNKMTRETGPVKFSTAPSPNLVRNAHCSCIIIILYVTHVSILYRFVLLQRSLYVYTFLWVPYNIIRIYCNTKCKPFSTGAQKVE